MGIASRLGASAPGTMTRRMLVERGAAALGAASLAGCGPFGPAPAPKPADLSGPFDLLMQAGSWQVAVEQQAKSLQQENPGVQVNIVQGGGSEQLAEKILATTAAGTPPDGFFHYSHTWRGLNAATLMLPLTPHLFRRDELERLTFPTMLDSVWATDRQVYFLPWLNGLSEAMLLYNADALGRQGIDPKSFTTLDAIGAGARRFVARDGGAITRAGLALDWPENVTQNWILDQGAAFYDEKNRKWTWQTEAAERALQWLVDVYDKLDVAWRPGQAPAGSPGPLIRGDLAMVLGAHASNTSGQMINWPDVKLWDMPLPSFVPGKTPHYYVPGIAGLSLAAALKPDSAKAKIGAALFRLVLSPEGSLVVADNYGGAILSRGLYESARFKETRFGALRANLAQQVLPRTQMLNLVVADSTTQPGFRAAVQKALAGQASTKAALAEIQQLFTVKEEEAWRNLR